MAKRHREEAQAALAPHFTTELYDVLAAAADRADGITYDGRSRYRTIPAGTPKTPAAPAVPSAAKSSPCSSAPATSTTASPATPAA